MTDDELDDCGPNPIKTHSPSIFWWAMFAVGLCLLSFVSDYVKYRWKVYEAEKAQAKVIVDVLMPIGEIERWKGSDGVEVHKERITVVRQDGMRWPIERCYFRRADYAYSVLGKCPARAAE
jgi:hypothetical protein